MTAQTFDASIYHGTSREYGNRKTLTVDGLKFVVKGCGYDTVGTLWGEYLTKVYSDRLRTLANHVLAVDTNADRSVEGGLVMSELY